MIFLTSRRKVPWIFTSLFARSLTSNSKHWPHKSPVQDQSKLELLRNPARTRFAPSPTGYLHLGSLRTALFNYLLAKSTGGQFLLRIEDTDRKRTVPDAEKRILEDLRWAGLQWDEGPEVGGPYGPYRQSENLESYGETAKALLFSGHAYRCFCSSGRLKALAMRRQKLGLPTDYDRTCASISEPESEFRALKERHVVRLRCPDQYPPFTDMVYGTVGKVSQNQSVSRNDLSTFEDPILLKSDGSPTYHLANIVDDHRMRITHVVRALEWLSATPKHILMYQALGWEPPKFAHVGLLVNEHGQKLSKRSGDLDISHFRVQKDIFPAALVNFVALLGWSHNRASDVMDLEQLINAFNFKFTKGNTTVTFEKLWYLQKNHVQLCVDRDDPAIKDIGLRISKAIKSRPKMARTCEEMLDGRDLGSYATSIVRADAKGYTTAKEFLERNCYFFKPVRSALHDAPAYDPQGPDQKIKHTTPLDQLVDAAGQIENVSQKLWTVEGLKTSIKSIISKTWGDVDKEARRRNHRALFHYLRWAIADGHEGASIADAMVILGQEITIDRLRSAAALCAAKGKLDRRFEAEVEQVQIPLERFSASI